MPMPPDLDVASIDALLARIQPRNDRQEWRGITAAFNGIQWRFRAAAQADEFLSSSFADPKNGHHDAEERFRQEDALFSFFVNAAAALEAFYCASYLIGAMLKPIQFPAGDPKDLRKYPHNVVKCFKSGYNGDPFTLALDVAQASNNWAALSEYRDMYIHRGALPRHHDIHYDHITRTANMSDVKRTTIAGNPKDLPGRWQPTLELNAGLTVDYRRWLASTLSTLCRAGEVFCQARLR